MRRYAWLLWLLAGVGAWALLAPRSMEVAGTAANPASAEVELGYTASDAELIETAPDGQPLYRLRAAHIAQPRPEAAITLTAPHLAYEHANGGRWTLQAERGTLSADRRVADFAGNVVGQHTQVRAAPLTLRTEALAVDLQRQLADASQPVRLEWGRARITAAGLHADMVSDTFVLTGPGRGRLHY